MKQNLTKSPARLLFKEEKTDTSCGARAVAYVEPAETPEETQRIARRIAATPELFRACRALIDAYALGDEDGGHPGSVDWEDVDQAHAVAMEAIAKTEGADR